MKDDYKPDPNRQSLTPSVAEFFSVLGEISLTTAGRIARFLLIAGGVIGAGAGLFVFIKSAVTVGVSNAR